MNRSVKFIGNQLSKRSTLFALILVVCLYLTMNLLGLTPNFGGQFMQAIGLGPPDPLWEDVPPDTIHIKLKSQDIRITRFNIDINVENEVVKVSCAETPSVYRSSGSQEVLLLHGSSSTSANWEKIRTMQLLSTWGHRSVAIDLPGFGRSSSTVLRQERRHSFLLDLMSRLQMRRPVIVAPSVSGFFAIPFCLRETGVGRCRALIGVGVSLPTGVDSNVMANFSAPGLAIYGKKDTFGERTARILAAAPGIYVRAVAEADLQPHLEQPEAFHRLLYNFLKTLR